jgi:hypothetical protein
MCIYYVIYKAEIALFNININKLSLETKQPGILGIFFTISGITLGR